MQTNLITAGDGRQTVIDIELEKLRTDGGTQLRFHINPIHIDEYVEAYSDGANMPPVVAFFDGTDYWLADGFHRLEAVTLLNARTIACEVRQGSLRDAILYAAGANANHGLRRTRDDKRKAIKALLADAEWGTRSSSWIAEQCGVSDKTVAWLRKDCPAIDDIEARGSDLSTPAQDAVRKSEPKRIGKNGVAQAATKKRKRRKSRYEILHVPPVDEAEPAGPVEIVAELTATATNNVKPCPNCGATTRTEDGDCSVCFDPCDEDTPEVEAKQEPAEPQGKGTFKVFLGEEGPISALDAVFGLWGVVTDELRDWPPSMREVAVKSLRDIAAQIEKMEVSGK